MDTEKRRFEILSGIKQKDRRTQSFVKDRQDALNLV